MNAKELLIRIKSRFDGDGVAQAQKGIDSVGVASEQTGERASSGFSKVRKGIDSVSKGVATLNKLVLGFGIIGMIANIRSAFNMFNSIVDGIGERMNQKIRESGDAARAFAESLSSQKMALASKIIDNVATAFNRVEKAIGSSRKASDDLKSAWQDLNQARQEITDMETDRREKEALAALDPKDEVGRTRVTNQYASIRVDTDLARKGGDAIRAEKAAEDAMADASARRENASQALDSAHRARGLIETQLEYSKQTANPLYNTDKKSMELAAKEVVALAKNLADLDTTIATLRDKIVEASSDERAGAVRLQAAQTRNGAGMSAADALARQDKSDLSKNTEAAVSASMVRAARERAQADLDALEERKNATVESRNETKQRLTFRASTEAAEATAAQKAHSPLARKEQAEARAAAQAVAAYAAETTAILKNLEGLMKAQRDALKRLPN